MWHRTVIITYNPSEGLIMVLEQKHKLEHSGFKYIESLVRPYNPELTKDIIEAWLEYEEARTPESCWVKEMDKFECLTQAYEYEQRTYGAKDLSEF
jgi:putative hydrolases of HD superfamily